MKDKFTIGLVWHNCETYPPKEYWNNNLYISDGEYVSRAEYSRENGWYDKTGGVYIYPDLVKEYWWADIEQTVRTSKEFAEALSKKEVAPNGH